MKNPRLALLVVSLLANAALGAWLLIPPTSSRPSAPPAAATAAPSTPATAVDPLTQPLTAATWSTLAKLSDADYVARLRAEGLPTEVVRNLVYGRIAARYADRLKVFNPDPNNDQYWRRNPMRPNAELSLEARKERRALSRQIQDEVKAVLGADASPIPDYQSRLYGPLPAEKVTQLEAISLDYSDLSAHIRDRSQGVTLPEDREQLRLLERERRADLEAALTPAELFEYDLRSSPASSAVRSQLTYFNATEEEFRALTALRLEFDHEFGATNLSEAEQASKRAAESRLLEQARTVLTPERYAEYALVSNNDFRNTARDLQRFNFDVAVAKDVFALRQSITARAETINANSLYTAEQRSAELAALYREASSSLTTKLGAKAYSSFESQGTGNWLRKLKPAATPAGPGGN